MRGYWTRIIVGALLVFAVGLTIWLLVRRTTDRVVAVVGGADALTIPLPFDIVPFKVDGDRLGALRKVVIHRDGPHSVERVTLHAVLADPAMEQTLSGCILSIATLDDLDEHSTFDCSREGPPAGMVPIGEVRVGPGESLPLFLPEREAGEIRHSDHAELREERLRLARRQVRMAEERSLIARAEAESLQAIMDRFSEAYGDSIAEVVAEQLEAAAARVRESARSGAAPLPPTPPPPPVEPRQP